MQKYLQAVDGQVGKWGSAHGDTAEGSEVAGELGRGAHGNRGSLDVKGCALVALQ